VTVNRSLDNFILKLPITLLQKFNCHVEQQNF